MKNRKHILIGCNILAAICLGLGSYSSFYEGKPGQGLIFLLLTISQLMIGIANINKAEEIEKKRPVIIVLLILMTGLCISICFTYFQKGFTGNRIKNPDAYLLEIEKMNGEDQHMLKLKEGDVLLVHSSVEKGSLNLEIEDPKGQIIYAGNEKNNVDEFQLNISESGDYIIEVEAHHTKGKVSVMLEKR